MGDLSGFLFVCGFFAVGMMMITILLNMIKYRWVKYIPSVLFAVSTAIMFALGQTGYDSNQSGSWSDLILIVLSIVTGITAAVGLITCFIIDWIHKIKQRSANQ